MERDKMPECRDNTSSMSNEHPTLTTATTTATAPSCPNPNKIRRRNRIITSCLECRRRKLKCDRSHPCNHCSKSSRDCIFLAPALDSASKGKLNQFKECLDSLEKGLRESGHARSLYVSNQNIGSDSPNIKSEIDDVEIPEDERNLEPTPLAVTDIAYEDEADDFQDELDLKFGKMRITERIGGFFRPRLSEEIAESFRRLGNLETFYEATEDTVSGSDAFNNVNMHYKIPTYVEPNVESLSPSNALLFPGTSSDDLSPLSFIPSQAIADLLLNQYWLAVHPIARVLHRPSFEHRYSRFWQDVASGYEPSYSLQAVVFGVMFTGVYALPTDDALRSFNMSRSELIPMLKAGCENALAKSNVIRTTRLETLQAFVIYLMTMCRDEVTRAHAALTSVAIRIAECAGLHRDGTLYDLSATETHVRRLVWYQLCNLDIRTCEAVGPRPQIRKEDFDTKVPLNVDDADLDSLIPPRTDANRWTEMTAAKINIECTEMMRTIWNERIRVEKRQISLAAVLHMIEDHRQEMQKKYLPLIVEKRPIQRLALRLFRLQISKMYIMLLHRYAISAPQTLPERLRGLVLASSITVLEEAIELETVPEFIPWSWLGKYIQQYHTALILMFEIYQNPAQREAERIWGLLAYVFEIPPFLTLREKIRLVVETLMERLYDYQKQRKQRLPTSMEQSLGGSNRPKPTWQHNINEKLDELDKRRQAVGKSISPQPVLTSTHSTSPATGVGSSQHSSRPPVQPFEGGAIAFPEWNGSPALQESSERYDASNNQPSANPRPEAGSDTMISSESMSTSMFGSGMHSQEQIFESMDWDELEKLFPADGNSMLKSAQLWSANDSDGDHVGPSLPTFNLFPSFEQNP